MNRLKVGVSLFVGLLSLSLLAQTSPDQVILVTGGFGIDGVTNKPMPKESSAKSAKKIFDIIDANSSAVRVKNGRKFLHSIEFSQDAMNFQIFVSSSFTEMLFEDSKQDNNVIVGLKEDLSFSGRVAQDLFEVMNVKGVELAGATNKTVANIRCEKITASKVKFSCYFKDINTSSLRGVTLKDILKRIPGGPQATFAKYGL